MARSRAGGHFFLSNDPKQQPTMLNDTLHTISSIIRHVLSSATEAELAALFINAKEAVIIRQTLIDMGWPQLSTPIQTDNGVAVGVANRAVKQQWTCGSTGFRTGSTKNSSTFFGSLVTKTLATTLASTTHAAITAWFAHATCTCRRHLASSLSSRLQ